MYPHVIRLRGPWETDFGRRVTMPCHWADVEGGASVRFLRRFGYPGRIDDFERVWLVGERLSGPARLLLNGQFLGEAGPGDFEFDATSRLGQRNALEIEIARGSDAERPWDDVALEVRCAAYLHGVRALEGEVTGEVRGAWTSPLELYVMRDGEQAAYQVVPPSDGPTPFSLLCEPGGSLRIDLVNVSSIWHRVEIDAG